MQRVLERFLALTQEKWRDVVLASPSPKLFHFFSLAVICSVFPMQFSCSLSDSSCGI